MALSWANITTSVGGKLVQWGSPMLYDTLRHKFVFAGGGGGVDGEEITGTLDLWELGSSVWTAVTVTGSIPSFRTNFIFVYDQARDRYLLYGGDISFAAVFETWEFNPNTGTWTNMAPANHPVAPAFCTGFYAPEIGAVICFGGFSLNPFTDAINVNNGDTYKWTGTNWVDMGLTTHPIARGLAAVCWDPNLNCVLLAGGHRTADGSGPPSGPLFDMWTFTTVWTDLGSPGYPSGVSSEPTLIAPTIENKVIEAPKNTNPFLHTKEWDGASWTDRGLLTGTPNPAFTANTLIGYDPFRKRTIWLGDSNTYELQGLIDPSLSLAVSTNEVMYRAFQ